MRVFLVLVLVRGVREEAVAGSCDSAERVGLGRAGFCRRKRGRREWRVPVREPDYPRRGEALEEVPDWQGCADLFPRPERVHGAGGPRCPSRLRFARTADPFEGLPDLPIRRREVRPECFFRGLGPECSD